MSLTIRLSLIIIAAASRKNIKFSILVPEQIPPVFADRRALKQILLNVLSNAVKFTPQGGKVKIEATTSGNCHGFIITDNGVGIATDKLDSLTDPFVRTESDPHKAQEGTGLGLSIVKSLVDLHNGDLSIESEVGTGTIVIVTFPPMN